MLIIISNIYFPDIKIKFVKGIDLIKKYKQFTGIIDIKLKKKGVNNLEYAINPLFRYLSSILYCINEENTNIYNSIKHTNNIKIINERLNNNKNNFLCRLILVPDATGTFITFHRI